MKRKNTTTKKSASDKPTTDQKHEKNPRWDKISLWAKSLCSGGDSPEAKTADFLLLMKELEDLSEPPCSPVVLSMVIRYAMQEGFAQSDLAYKAADAAVAQLRRKAAQ